MNGRIEGLALVVGSADCAFDDLAPFKDRADIVIAVNAMIVAYPGDISVGVTLHSEFTPWYRSQRDLKQTTPWTLYSLASNDGVDHVVAPRWIGTSSLYGVQLAMDRLGARRIVLAGVPLDTRPKFDQPNCLEPWLQQYRDNWTQAKEHFTVPVHSVSGWTRDLLGEPPADWLD